MAQYPSVVVTEKGHDLISTANAINKAVTYIKAVVGDGQLNNQSIESLTAMISPKLELPLSTGVDLGDGQWRVSFALSNSTLTNGFYAREVGVFAKLDGQDDSTAILFGYTNGGNYVDYIPPKTTPIDSQVFNCDFVIGDAENVTVNILDGTFVTHQVLTNAIDEHNTDSSAHDARFIAITQQINNMITPIDDALKQDLAPTLALVKTLLSNFDIKNSTDVITALDTETLASLGVSYSLTNKNAWYICLGKLFGGLIIQGGNNLVRANRDALITLPISYTKFFVPVSNPEYDAIHNFTINMVSVYSGVEGLNKVKLSTDVWGDSDVDKEIYCWWVTVGI